MGETCKQWARLDDPKQPTCAGIGALRRRGLVTGRQQVPPLPRLRGQRLAPLARRRQARRLAALARRHLGATRLRWWGRRRVVRHAASWRKVACSDGGGARSGGDGSGGGREGRGEGVGGGCAAGGGKESVWRACLRLCCCAWRKLTARRRCRRARRWGQGRRRYSRRRRRHGVGVHGRGCGRRQPLRWHRWCWCCGEAEAVRRGAAAADAAGSSERRGRR